MQKGQTIYGIGIAGILHSGFYSSRVKVCLGTARKDSIGSMVLIVLQGMKGRNNHKA